MRRLALVVVLAVIAPAIAIAGGDVGARSQDQIEQARNAVLTDDYQSELPGSELEAGSGTGSGEREPFERGGEDRYERYRRDHYDTRQQRDEGGSGMFTMLMWIVVIVGIALLVFWIASELIKYGGDEAALAAAEPKPGDSALDMAVIERPLGDAEELAKRGEFREAIHTLLLRTLQELVRSAAVRVGPAMTSREILARVPLLADARDALHALIITVELTHFGGDDATVDDYVQCRSQFQKFATAFRASAARAANEPGAVPTTLGSNA